MKKLLISFISLTLAACAFNDKDFTDKQETEDNLYLENLYSSVRGTYEGEIASSTGPRQVRLQIYTLSVKDGVNTDGTNRFRIVPKAFITKINPVGNSQTMDIRYIPERAQVLLSTTNPSLGDDDIHTINANLTSQTLTGEALSSSGPLGQITLSLVSRESTSPGSGSNREEYANNLMKEYMKIAGEYRGRLENSKVDKGLNYDIFLRLFVVKEVVGNDILPVLKGFYRRGDDDAAIFDLALNVAYDPVPGTITLSGKGEGRYYLAMDGYIRDGKITVTFSTHRGNAGLVDLVKIK